MTQKSKTKPNDDSFVITDETGVRLYLSDDAANRLAWFFTWMLGILSLPVIILAFVAC